MKCLVVILLITSSSLFAAGGGHAAGHFKDLFYPAINFTILMSFFIWKVLPLIKKGFNNNHKQISESFSLAEIKEVEAQAELAAIEKKLSNIEKEIQSIQEATSLEAKSYNQTYAADTDHRISRSQQEVGKRVEGEKNDALSAIMGELLDEIVMGAKKTVSTDDGKKRKVLESFSTKL